MISILNRFRIASVLPVAFLCVAGGLSLGATAKTPSLPAWIEPNDGQARPDILFVGRAHGYTFGLDRRGTTQLQLPHGESYDTVRMELNGARSAKVEGEDRLASFTRLYRGPQAVERVIPHFASVRCREAYPGIDFVWKAAGTAFQYEFHVRAGARPERIQMRFRGATALAVSSTGELVLQTGRGELRYRRPAAFQGDGNERAEVAAGYRIDGRTVSIQLGRYDGTKPLVIDPIVYSTYLGGSGYDAVNGVATDTSGNVYIAGETASSNFPSTTGVSTMVRSAFAAKLAPGMTALRWITILASTGNSRAASLAVDSSGNSYICGAAGGSGFPVSATALYSTVLYGPAGFVAKFGTTGTLLYSTILGQDNTTATAIALDGSGYAYVTGWTQSYTFPVTSGAPQTLAQGLSDAFVTKVNLSGPAIVYSTRLGGSGTDVGNAIAVTSVGVACIAGTTSSSGLPVQNALYSSYMGSGDAMVGCLNAAGTSWSFLTYWGGVNPDAAYGIAIDSGGRVIIAGTTMSTSFPLTIAATVQGYDAFVTELSSTGAAAVFSRLLGGSGSDAATSLAVDTGGSIWVGGYTSSVDFTQQLPVQSAPGGSMDGFVAELSSSGSTILLSSYLGGVGDDRVLGIATRGSGTAVVAGTTSSSNFTTTSSVIRTALTGSYDGFVTEITGPTVSAVTLPGIGVFSNGNWKFDANNNRVWDGTTGGDIGFALGQTGDQAVVGDWNGDGRSKAGFFRGGFWLLDFNGSGTWDGDSGDHAFWMGQAGDVPVVGDWNGDGRSKVGVFRNGMWVFDYNGSGTWDGLSVDRAFYMGQAGDTPVVGDWNGDGRSKMGFFRGGFWLLDYNGNANWDGYGIDSGFWLGTAGDIPVVGDWSGDGKTKVGFFRNGLWLLDYNGNGSWDGHTDDRSFSLGQAGDIPVVGDWNGDGRTKVGVYRAGVWILDYNGDYTPSVTGVLGSSDSTPLIGKWK